MEALNYLDKNTNVSQDAVIMLKSQLNTLEKQNDVRVIKHEDYTIERN